MADEENAGAAYLAALKQLRTSALRARASARARCAASGSRLDPAAPTLPARRQAPKSAIPLPGKRPHPRNRDGVAIWTTFTDISLHGCYVETTTTYSRRRYRSGLKLEANGFRVEATGEVRVIYPNLGMGISFTNMPEEDRERLRELVRSLSRPSVIVGSRVADARRVARPTESCPRSRTPAPLSRPCAISSKTAT